MERDREEAEREGRVRREREEFRESVLFFLNQGWLPRGV